MFKVLLCIPADYDYNFPPLGTAALCAFLKNKRILTHQVDLNIKYRTFLIKHIYGSSISCEEKKLFLKTILKKFFCENLKGHYYSQFLPRNNDGIFPYLPYDNNSNSSFYFTERLLSSEYLFRYLEDAQENTFYQFYENEKFLDFLDKEKINLLGISIISPSQVIASFTLGLVVKKYLPYIHICIGGQWPTLYRKALLERKDLFKCFDSIIVFEGETPLYRLVTALKKKKEVFIPNVIFKNTETDFSQNHTEEDLDSLPCPDFDGLPLDTYDATQENEKINLTYETSRGCYWSKCAYCVDLPLPKPSYRRKNPDLVVRDIKQLQKKYKVSNLMVSDPGLSPRQILGVSQRIIKEEIKIDWWCMARLDPGFNSKIFKLAAQAGLKQVNFGFESASDHICELLHKGNKKEQSARIIRECTRSGIKVDLQTMLGLPKETFQDGLETIDFLIQNKKLIFEVTFNVYYLTPSNFIYQNPEKYGIAYEDNSSLPFRFFVPFKNLYGITKKEAHLLEQLYYKLRENDIQIYERKEIPWEKVLGLSEDISWEQLEFRWNGESSRMDYLRNNKTANYIGLDDKGKTIIDCIKEGFNLKDIYSSLLKNYPQADIDSIFYEFLDNVIENKFLVERT